MDPNHSTKTIIPNKISMNKITIIDNTILHTICKIILVIIPITTIVIVKVIAIIVATRKTILVTIILILMG